MSSIPKNRIPYELCTDSYSYSVPIINDYHPKLYCRTALHYAVCKKNLHIVDLLLNCDIVTGLFMQDDEGNNPLHKV